MEIMAKVNRTPEVQNRLIDETCEITQIFTETCDRKVISVFANYSNIDEPVPEARQNWDDKRQKSDKENLNSDSKENVESESDRGTKRHKIEASPRKRMKHDSYYSMTESERDAFDKECERKAELVSLQQLEAGKPFAPFNTTEFIMEEHDPLEDSHLLDEIVVKPKSSEQLPSSQRSDDYYMPQLNEEEYLQREFSNDYEKTEYDILTNMTNWELVNEYMVLEDEIAELENRINLPLINSLNYESPDEFSDTEYASEKRERSSGHLENESEQEPRTRDDVSVSSSKQIDESEHPLFEPIYDETAEKIRITNEEIRKLTEENELLRGMIERNESESIPTCLCIDSASDSDSESGTEDTDSDSSSSSSASSTADSSTDSSSSDSEEEVDFA